MDASGYAYLILAVLLFAAVLTAIHFLTKDTPRLTTLLVGAALFFGTMVAGGSMRASRFGTIVAGVLQLSGFVTMIIGVFRLFRRQQADPAVGSETPQDKGQSQDR
jgi:hypothetical protein